MVWGMGYDEKEEGRGLAAPRELVMKPFADCFDEGCKAAKQSAQSNQPLVQGFPPLLFLSHALHLLSTSLFYHEVEIMSRT